MHDLDRWLYSARFRAVFLAALGGVVFGGASAAVSIGAPESFQSARGRHVAARQYADPGTLSDCRSGPSAVVQPALTITKVVRRDHTPREGRYAGRGPASVIPASIRPASSARGEPAVLAANAANLTRLCRYLL